MIRFSVLLGFSLVFSCSIAKKSYVYQHPLMSMSISDRNLYVTIKYLEEKQKRICNGQCDYSVNSNLFHFDSCFIHQFDHLLLRKSSMKTKLNVPQGRYNIDGFGLIRFFQHKVGEKPDFQFSPILIDNEKAEIYGLLLFKDGKRSAYTFRMLNDDIIFLYDRYYYEKDCTLDVDSY
jgi:hypothetical protein